MYNEKIFELKTRKEIYDYIMSNPGMHLRDISRSLKMPVSTLEYHLRYLEKRDFLSKDFENGYSRFYVTQNVGKNDKKLFNVLRETVPRNIILYLCLYSNSSQTDMINFAKKWKNHPSKIGHYLNKHHTTLGFHLKKLINEDIVESYECGNEVRYRLKNPEDIFDLIIRYDKSILADAFGRFLKWFEDARWGGNMDEVIGVLWDVFPHPYHV